MSSLQAKRDAFAHPVTIDPPVPITPAEDAAGKAADMLRKTAETGRVADRAGRRRHRIAGLRELGALAISLLVGLIAWHLLTTHRVSAFVNFSNVPTPLQVLTAFAANAGSSAFWTHIGVSIMRVAASYGLAAAIGIPLGLLMGHSRIVRFAAIPYVEILRPIPAVAWIPLAILMWPTQEASIVFITFLGAVFPIILNTMHGAEQTPELLVRAVRSLGAGRLAVFRYVVVPAALSSIATGLAIGMGVAWFSLLAGEIISGQYGIGYFTWDSYSMVRTPDIVVGMLTIGALGSLSTWLVRIATRPLLRWQQKAR